MDCGSIKKILEYCTSRKTVGYVRMVRQAVTRDTPQSGGVFDTEPISRQVALYCLYQVVFYPRFLPGFDLFDLSYLSYFVCLWTNNNKQPMTLSGGHLADRVLPTNV